MGDTLAMLSQDDLQSAQRLQEQTNEFLSKYEIAPTPINYSVVYLCLSKKITKLTHAVSDQLSEKGYLDAVFLENIFHQFVLESAQKEQECPYCKMIRRAVIWAILMYIVFVTFSL